jgi:protein CpxP
MKKLILILFAVAIASANMFAQEAETKEQAKKTPEERATNTVRRMTKDFSLTAEQQAKVKVLILKMEQDREAEMNAKKEIKAKMDAEMKMILNSEQFEKFINIEQKMKAKREENRETSKPTAPPAAPEKK